MNVIEANRLRASHLLLTVVSLAAGVAIGWSAGHSQAVYDTNYSWAAKELAREQAITTANAMEADNIEVPDYDVWGKAFKVVYGTSNFQAQYWTRLRFYKSFDASGRVIVEVGVYKGDPDTVPSQRPIATAMK